MNVASRVDEILRDLAARRLRGVPARAGPGPGRRGGRLNCSAGSSPPPIARKPTSAEREALVESLATTYGERLAVQVLPTT